MLSLFRKYQRQLFFLIAVVTIASFLCFGITPSGSRQNHFVDREIGRCIDGSPIMEREVRAMIDLFSLSSDQRLHGFISKGFALILAERYFPQLEEDFKLRLEKARNYAHYVHPEASSLNALNIWKEWSPQLANHLSQFQQEGLSIKALDLYLNLYLDQLAFPPEMLRRVVLYQIQNQPSISLDYRLRDARLLSLFGNHSFEDWFGTKYSELLVSFFLNASAIAEEKGYQVSFEEAEADLLRGWLKQLPSAHPTIGEARQLFLQQLTVAQVEERKAIDLWRKVMLADRLFEDAGQTVLLDFLSYQKFALFTDETATVELYQLPEIARCKEISSFLLLRYYLAATVPKEKGYLTEIPRHSFSVEQVELSHPELVVRRYLVDLIRVPKKQISDRISLKEIWNYQVSDEGWLHLMERYPQSIREKGLTREERLALLEKIVPSLRLEIDRATRFHLVDQHPEWIEEEFLKENSRPEKVALNSRGEALFLDEIEKSPTLATFLETASLGESFSWFKSSSNYYYRMVLVQNPIGKEVFSFKEIKEEPWFQELVEEELRTFYLKNGEENGKDYAAERERVIFSAYGKDLEAISQDVLPLDRYPIARSMLLMEQARQEISLKGEEASLLIESGNPLIDQWRLEKQITQIKRKDAFPFLKGEFFSLQPLSWTSVSASFDGNVAFGRLLERKSSLDPSQSREKVIQGQQLLAIDAQRSFMHQLLDRLEMNLIQD